MGKRIIAFLKTYWIPLMAIIIFIAAALASIDIYREEVLNIDPQIEYEEQNTLYFAAETIDTLNPLVSQSEEVYYLSKLLYNGLFAYDENMGIIRDLVESYTVDTERAYIEIKLRRGVKWHNGKELNSKDVQFTVNAIKAAGERSPYYKKVARIVAVNVTGKYKFNIYFNNNYNCSLDDLTFPIVPSDQYDTVQRFINVTESFKPVGTGRYQYESYNYLKSLNLKPNKEYFLQPAENFIQVNILPDVTKATKLMEIHEVTCYFDETVERKSIVADQNYVMYDILSNQVEFIVFNVKNKELRNNRIRQTIAYGINTEKVLKNAYMGDGVISDTIYYPNYLGVEEEGNVYGYDYEHAKKSIADMGYVDSNGDGYIENLHDEKVIIRILVNKEDTNRVAAAKIIKKNLEDLGLQSIVLALPKKEYLNSIKTNNFDLLITGYKMNEGYDLRELYNGKNAWGYSNYNLSAMAGQLERLRKAEEYNKYYKELKEALIEQVIYYPLCYKKVGLVGLATFQAERLPQFNNIYQNCDTWGWKKISLSNVDENGAQE